MATAPTQSPPALRRVLTLWQLVFYGLSIIVGAGIYVALGSVMERAGDAAPMSFLLAACAAALTGLCYAELASRFPEAAGAASYVQHGLNSRRLGQITGLVMALAVSIAAAAIAQGAAEYIAVIVSLPTALITATLIAVFTAIALLGVRESVGFAIAMGVVEIAGLLAATIAGFASATDISVGRLLPADSAAWIGVAAGANIAFFAFIGFETLANMAEETVDAARNIPRAILGSLAASTVLYVAVSTAIVFAGVTAANPMLALFEGRAATVFAGLGSVAVANGALIEIVMLARIFYGMARKAQLPAILGVVDERSQTPVRATLLAGAIVMTTALFLPFEHLLVAANALTLAVFALVAVALWRIKSTDNSTAPFSVPQWLPPVATGLSLLLIAADLLT